MCREKGVDAGTGNHAYDWGAEEVFTQAFLPVDTKPSFMKGQDTEAK